ncbi:M48 family metallopeptidase, partial [Bacteroidota bacterium]
SQYISNNYLLLLAFFSVIGIALSILFFPVKYYIEFYLEHKYNLSNQNIFSWLWEDIKGLLVGLVIGIPIILIFYYAISSFGSLWWLPFSVFMFLVSVIIAKILPILIFPIFYKVKSLENEELKQKILALSSNIGMKVENVYMFNMSKNTKKANAAFTGLGKTKRILLADTLINEYSIDEIETVLAHELGHYKYKHIIKNLVIGTIISFLMFYLIAVLYDVSLEWFGFTFRIEIGALPLLALWGMIVSLVLTPITNIISRKFEYQADKYAAMVTKKVDIFIRTLERLNEQNLGDKNPHPIVEWYFYSHPSVQKRINYLSTL